MTNFDKMEQNFVTLTEEELMNVDGGVSWEVVSVGIAIGWGIYQVGEAAGKTFYYITHPQFLINMSKKAFWIILLVITIVVTGIGLGLSAYNYYASHVFTSRIIDLVTVPTKDRIVIVCSCVHN